MTGAALKDARDKLGLTQAQLADALGLGSVHGRNTVARLEKRDNIPGTYRLAVEALLKRKTNAQD
jgi:transcriptional regulator with XRE-family HTH domain